MYLAGTVIFGGGPVVIPLLRSYVVDPGYVSPRDFLIGLALIQAFPGPNFNFAVYLGALALQNGRSGGTGAASITGALLGFLGIFVPGLTLALAVQSFWRVLRRRKWVADLLRGINATAVGLVFTAVYRLWEIGYLTKEESRGRSLAKMLRSREGRSWDEKRMKADERRGKEVREWTCWGSVCISSGDVGVVGL